MPKSSPPYFNPLPEPLDRHGWNFRRTYILRLPNYLAIRSLIHTPVSHLDDDWKMMAYDALETMTMGRPGKLRFRAMEVRLNGRELLHDTFTVELRGRYIE